MNIEQQLTEAYQLLIPITNVILFDQETKPIKEEKGYKLVDDFMNSFNNQQDKSTAIVKRVVDIIGTFLANYNIDQKAGIMQIFMDNESLIGVTYVFSCKSPKMEIDEFVNQIIGELIGNGISEGLAIFLNLHFLFIYEMKLQNGYISDSQYNQVIKRISKKAI